jgi:hypothetical protein
MTRIQMPYVQGTPPTNKTSFALRSLGWLLLVLVVLVGCSDQDTPSTRVRAQAITEATYGQYRNLAGFENAAAWTIQNGNVGQSVLHTEGAYSLAITNTGWSSVSSSLFPVLGPVSDQFRVDFFHTQSAEPGPLLQ